MIRILIVDDEPPARTRLRQRLGDCAAEFAVDVVGEAAGGAAAVEAAARLQPDLVLLDIAMPDMSGIEAARHLARLPAPPAVVFVTAFDDHAIEAFEVQAVDYLLKPVRTERLAAALARVRRRAAEATPGAAADVRLASAARALGVVRTRLAIAERGRMHFVPITDIVYLRAELKYVTVRTPEREYCTEESLASLETEFHAEFVRVHRSALVARARIAGFERVRSTETEGEGGEAYWQVVLHGVPDRLPVSRRQWPTVKGLARS